jgi:3-(3-hydroxy-phenyl)propionate hydroxylase
LSADARAIWQRLGGCFVVAKPDTQLSFHDDVPEDVIAIGDVNTRLKDWFARVPESVVLLRPDRFVAGMGSPQQVSQLVGELARKLHLEAAACADAAGTSYEAALAHDGAAPVSTVAAAGA